MQGLAERVGDADGEIEVAAREVEWVPDVEQDLALEVGGIGEREGLDRRGPCGRVDQDLRGGDRVVERYELYRRVGLEPLAQGRRAGPPGMRAEGVCGGRGETLRSSLRTSSPGDFGIADRMA